MKIDGWHIDGFGIFNQYEVRDLRSGLTVFLGPNEAGKSTLLAFLQGVLFGFPDGRSRSNLYPPVRGGNHGGRLFLQYDGRPYTVERSAGGRKSAIIYQDGDELDESALGMMLGGADKGLFCSVFSFDLTELQDFDRLDREGVHERIFSAGIVGAGKSAREVAGFLTDEADRIYKHRGRNQLLPELRTKRQTLQQKLQEALRSLDVYEQMRQEEDALDSGIRDLDLQQRDLENRQRQHRLLCDLWPVWHRLDAIRKKLAELEEIDAFPASAEEQLAKLSERIRSDERQMAEMDEDIRTHTRSIGEFESRLDDRLPPLSQAIELLDDERSIQRKRIDDARRLVHEVDGKRDQIKEAIADLGPGWSTERIAAFDASLAVRQELGGWKDRLGERKQMEMDARRAVEYEKKKLVDADRERERLRENLEAAEPVDVESLERREMALRRLRALFGERSGASAYHDALSRTLEEPRRRIAELDAGLAATPSERTVRAVQIAGVVLLVLMLPAFIAGWLVAGIVIAVLAVAVLAAALWMSFQQREAAGDRAEKERLESRLSTDEESLAKFAIELDRIDQAIGEACHALEVEVASGPADLERHASELEKQRRVQIQYDSERRRLDDVSERIKAIRDDLARAEEAHQEASRSFEHEQREWRSWKERAGLDPHLSPDDAGHFLEEIRKIKAELESIEKLESDRKRLAASIEEWEDRAVEALRSAGELDADARPEGIALVDALSALHIRLQDDRKVRAGLEAAKKALEDAARKRKPVMESLTRSRSELTALLEEAGAADEGEFRHRLGIYRERLELNKEAGEREEEIDRRLGRSERADEIRNEVTSGNVHFWQQVVSDASHDLDELAKTRVELIRNHQTLLENRKRLEESADVPALETELKAVEAEISEAARQWCVYTVAGTLVRDTLAEFMKTRQPEVLQEASAYFRTVTRGAYQHVSMSEDGQSLHVENRAGARRKPEELSRGTAEQLYLCLRFGLAAEYARKQVALPLVMDDVLVNFDPERAAAVADVVAQVAERHQVLLFTCHPSTAEMLHTAAGSPDVIEMERYGTALRVVQ